MENKKNEQAESSKTFWVIILTVIITALITGGGVYAWQKYNENNLKQEISDLEIQNKQYNNSKSKLQKENNNSQDQSEKQEKSSCSTKSSSASKENKSKEFENAVNSKDYDKIETFLTNPINFIIEATECCGDITPEEAANSMDYIDGVNSFDFSQDQDIVKKIKDKYSDYSNDIIGIGDNKAVLIYHLNSEEKVDRIYLSITYEMFDLN